MNYRNARIRADGRINCEIETPEYGWLPFLADPNDTGANFDVAELHARMAADPETSPYVPPTQEELDAAAAGQIRAQRDYILATQVDPVVTNPLRWADLSAGEQTAVADYRRALLDIPEQAGFPHSVEWPAVPAVLS